MTAFAITDLATWLPAAVEALAALLAGYGAGVIHFRLLKSVVRRFVAGELSAIALQLVRFIVLGAILWWASRWGAHVLLAALAGIMFGRLRVLAGERS